MWGEVRKISRSLVYLTPENVGYLDFAGILWTNESALLCQSFNTAVNGAQMQGAVRSCYMNLNLDSRAILPIFDPFPVFNPLCTHIPHRGIFTWEILDVLCWTRECGTQMILTIQQHCFGKNLLCQKYFHKKVFNDSIECVTLV